MQNIVFTKRISKGTRFNQIYVPRELEISLQPGDLVEVRLIEKKEVIYFHNIKFLSDFKKELITKIFQKILHFRIEQIFVVGSFLHEKTQYHDIDIVIILDKLNEKVEKQIYDELTAEFSLNFHLLSIKKDNLEKLLKICPLTKSMFEIFASNKELKPSYEKIIDKNHLLMLLMMPEDLLEIDVNSRVYYDGLRRAITIRNFLINKSLSSKKVNEEVENILGSEIFQLLRNNELIDNKTLQTVRERIREELNKINKLIK